MKKICSVALVALLSSYSAIALAEDADGDGVEDEVAADTTATEEPAPATGGADFWKMGLSFALSRTLSLAVTGAGDLESGVEGENTANFLYGLNEKAYLDLQIGINFAKSPEVAGPPASGGTVFGIDLGIGYRMYKPMSGKVRPYLEPMVRLAIDDFSEAGGTLFFGLGAAMGVDYQVWDQFTLGGMIGGALGFDGSGPGGDPFKVISFGLFSAGINATFWWK